MMNTLSKAERTRNFIIEKAAPLFNEKGYAGTSLNDMIAATGLTKGSIYGNFTNKDEVALAAFDHNFGKISSYIREAIASREGYINKLLVYPDTYRHFLSIPFLKAGCPVLNTATEADDTHPELKAKAAQAIKLWRSNVESLIKLGKQAGEIKTETDPAAFASILMSLIEGAIMQCKVTNSTAVLHHAMDYLTNLIRDLKS